MAKLKQIIGDQKIDVIISKDKNKRTIICFMGTFALMYHKIFSRDDGRND